MYGIIGAMESEVALLRGRMRRPKEHTIAGIDFWAGAIAGTDAVLARSGIGKVNAAMCAQLMIDRFSVDKLINTGIAGGVAQGLAVGDFIVGTSSVQHDFDLGALHYVRGYMGSGGDGSRPTIYYSDAGLVAEFKRAAANVLPDSKIKEGVIATGDIFVESSVLKKELHALFFASAVEMEGAAIAQVARANGVASVIVRTVSDLADEEAGVSFASFEKAAADVSANILLHMLENAGKHSVE